MGLLLSGTKQAFWLLLAGDPEVWRITFLSLQISISATLVSLLIGIPLVVTITVGVCLWRRGARRGAGLIAWTVTGLWWWIPWLPEGLIETRLSG